MTATRSRSRSRRSNSADRFTERRHEIRKQRGARRLRWVAGLALVALLAVAAIAIANSPALAVDKVTVNGVDRDRAEQVYRASRLEAGLPLLDVDTAAASSSVRELPWVRTAEVERGWNGTVVINVEPRQILFALATPDQAEFVAVDSEGIQIARLSAAEVTASPLASASTVGDPAEGVPLIHGLVVNPDPGAIAPPEAALAINFLVAVPDSVRSVVREAEVVDQTLQIHLMSGGVALFGDSRLLGAKFQALETILNQVDLACLETVDISAPTAPSVTRTCQPGETSGQDG